MVNIHYACPQDFPLARKSISIAQKPVIEFCMMREMSFIHFFRDHNSSLPQLTGFRTIYSVHDSGGREYVEGTDHHNQLVMY